MKPSVHQTVHAKLLLVAIVAGVAASLVACLVLRTTEAKLAQAAQAVAIVVVGSVAAAALATTRLRRSIAAPIAELNQAGRWALEYHDYAWRVTKAADDELGDLCDLFNTLAAELQRGELAEQRACRELELALDERTAELDTAKAQLAREIHERRSAERQLEGLRGDLAHSARTAGMAQIATGVLDDAANVLGSIQVSAELACGRIRQSKVTELARAVEAIEAHQDDLAEYLTRDPQGRGLAGLLALLVAHLADERADVLAELELLAGRARHAKGVVATQQSYAAGGEPLETSGNSAAPMRCGDCARLRAA